MLFSFVPLLIIAFLMAKVEAGHTGAGTLMAYYLSVFMFMLGTGYALYQEVKELNKNGTTYFRNPTNYYQLVYIGLSMYLLFLTFFASVLAMMMSHKEEDSVEAAAESANKLRIVMVLTLQFQVLEFFQRVKMFDFFAAFVRQLQEIVMDSLPLASMLAFIVLAQTMLFWILDQNSSEPAYSGWEGFGNCMIDSYRLALGDFEGTENFIGNSPNMFVYWVVFVICSIISLLVILNMVIAVMGATFERVDGETQVVIIRQRLLQYIDNRLLLPNNITQALKKSNYLIVIKADPEVDPIPEETMESRIIDRFSALETNVSELNSNVGVLQQTLNALFERLDSIETPETD